MGFGHEFIEGLVFDKLVDTLMALSQNYEFELYCTEKYLLSERQLRKFALSVGKFLVDITTPSHLVKAARYF